MVPQQTSLPQELLAAVHFAAVKHRHQRRKGTDAAPYINHPIAVAELLARVGGVTDLCTLQAAILHDTIEDTQTTAGEISQRFGPGVLRVVQEVTDDNSLPKLERKRLQILHAPHLSTAATLVKLADKISNLAELSPSDPVAWTLKQKREYLDWAEKVVAGLRGCHPALEELFDQTVREKRKLLGI